MEQSYRQIPADVRLRWENEKQRMALEAYNLQRHQEKEAEIAQQEAEEAERNNHSTAWIIWDEVGVLQKVVYRCLLIWWNANRKCSSSGPMK